jgi:L-glyceraldehyde 3-phosphate reductase
MAAREIAHVPNATRYNQVHFRRCGRSGLVLPAIAPSLLQNFDGVGVFQSGRSVGVFASVRICAVDARASRC